MANKKNRNYYKANKFKSVSWSAKVENDTTKQVATLAFNKDFNSAANDLKSMKSKINKDLNNVTKQIKKIKKDSKTGELLKSSLTSQLNAYETARKDFLKAIKNLYNGAISEYNNFLQKAYESLQASNITNQGSATSVQNQNIAADDNAGIDGEGSTGTDTTSTAA